MGALLMLLVVILVAWVAVNAVAGLVGFLIMVGFWMLIGYIVGKLMRGEDYGLLGNAALGAAGGIVGSIVLRILGMSFGDIWVISNVLVGVFGAVILIYAVRLFGNKDFGR